MGVRSLASKMKSLITGKLISGHKASSESYYKHGNIRIERYKAIYFFVPKAACTSLKAWVVPHAGVDVDANVHNIDFPFANLEKVLQGEFEEYFKFTFVRNPFDRLVSCYRNKIKEKDYDDSYFVDGVFNGFLEYKDEDAPSFWGGMSFDAFARAVCKIPDCDSEPHFRSQTYLLSKPDGSLIVDYVGYFERLNKDLHQVCELSGIPFSPLQHLMKSGEREGTKYIELYTPELLTLVANRYAYDFERLGYQIPESI